MSAYYLRTNNKPLTSTIAGPATIWLSVNAVTLLQFENRRLNEQGQYNNFITLASHLLALSKYTSRNSDVIVKSIGKRSQRSPDRSTSRHKARIDMRIRIRSFKNVFRCRNSDRRASRNSSSRSQCKSWESFDW